MLINLSNHPSDKWGKEQIEITLKTYGSVQDIIFPAIDPLASSAEVRNLARSYFKKLSNVIDRNINTSFPVAVHLQGEFTFVYSLVSLLKKSGIKCLASTTKRDVEELENGKKIIKFNFVQFREY